MKPINEGRTKMESSLFHNTFFGYAIFFLLGMIIGFISTLTMAIPEDEYIKNVPTNVPTDVPTDVLFQEPLPTPQINIKKIID